MSFENNANKINLESNNEIEHQFDAYRVHEGRFESRPREIQGIQARLAENERLVCDIKASFVDSFKSLNPVNRESILSAIPAHWTGAEYPLYDLLRAQA